MTGRFFLFVALTLLVARGQDSTPPVPSVSTTACEPFPQVTCTSTDALALNDTLQLAIDTRDSAAPLLQLGPAWRFAVHIHVLTPDDPLTAQIDHEAAAVFAHGSTMTIEAVVPIGDPTAREFIQRQFVTALLWEKFFANTTSFDKHTRLDVVPFWLTEGLREWINQDPDHIRESIVQRAVKNQTAPLLAEVTGWRELSNDRLLGLWQRAFSFYLFDSLTEKGDRRTDFQQWLGSFSTPGGQQAQLHFPTETAWQRELAESPDRSHDILYTWAQTAAALEAKEVISYAASKEGTVQNCTLDSVAAQPRSDALMQAVQERITVLTALEIRAHPGWQPVLEAYRSALSAFLNKDNKAAQLFAQARHWRDEETQHHQKLIDYINWFEVTRDYSDGDSQFQTYFSTAQEMKRVLADPKNPNPIRANVLQIESEL